MIKITGISVAGDLAVGDRALDLSFSDGATARWQADDIIARDTELTRALEDPNYFARAFVECGALAWPNGLEFSPEALHRKLAESGALMRRAA